MKKAKYKRAVFYKDGPKKPSASKHIRILQGVDKQILNVSLLITATNRYPEEKNAESHASGQLNQNPYSDFHHIVLGRTECCIKLRVPLNANTHNSEMCKKRGHAFLQDSVPMQMEWRPYCGPFHDLSNLPVQLHSSFPTQEENSTWHSKETSATWVDSRQGSTAFLQYALCI